VVASKKVGGSSGEKAVRNSSINSMALFWLISSPFILKRSVNRIRWGEEYNPTLRPVSFRIEAIKAATDPLPFVPAMWIYCRPLWGFPNDFNRFGGFLKARILSRISGVRKDG